MPYAISTIINGRYGAVMNNLVNEFAKDIIKFEQIYLFHSLCNIHLCN